ncbi:hypothetical protein OHS33_12900 [Streptomyces sp. NBC_00536]|uniref:DUF6879 family protein n=1 Tax=Streptomyces sp. NBC_00536 TaxID=2975769 RepID=UPI002E8049CC|nr:DUF6879 family protein [Streptomyces sp. NBC_00536]WUC79158.1 hypothetical protein OHS33_12900 [Streptomyces sp. NBC_00536]
MPDTLGDWLKGFSREAFRLETLDDYSKAGGVDAYRAFLAGEPQPEKFQTAEWMTTVGNAVQSGKRIYRVHVLARPLTDYLRFELSWGYRRNIEAGEEFFILDITSQENPIPDALDFWLFDEQTVGAMNYDGEGKYLGLDFPGEEQLSRFLTYRDVAMAHAVPFSEWWAKYGE